MFRTVPLQRVLRRPAAVAFLALAAGACGDLPVSPTGDEYGNEYENFEATPPHACTPDGALSVGATRQGEIEEGDCARYPGDRYDRWTLSLDQETQIRIDLRSGAFDTMLELLNRRGDMIAVNDDSHGTLNSRVVAFLAPGDYDVIARPYGQGMRGSYEIGVALSEGCGGDASIVLGEEIAGEITDDDCLMDQWMPADSFSLTLSEDTRLDFTAKSPDFRPLVVVRDARRWDVFVAHDETGSGTAHGRATLGAGTYVVYVLSDGPGYGAYQLLVEEVGCELPRPVAVGETVQGTLDESDCVRSGGAFRDGWALELDAERTLRIDLASDDLDAWLAVLDEDGVEVATDDDSGPGFDASLRVTLAPGRYTLVASSFGPGQVGDYTLSVVEDGTVAAAAVAASTGAMGDLGAAEAGGSKPAPWLTPDGAARRLLERLQASPKRGV